MLGILGVENVRVKRAREYRRCVPKQTAADARDTGRRGLETWQHADASGRSISDRLRLMLRMLARIAMMAAKIAVMLALPFPWRLSKQVADDAADAGGSGRGDQNELQLMLMMLFSFGCGLLLLPVMSAIRLEVNCHGLFSSFGC